MKKFILFILFFPIVVSASSTWPVCSDTLGQECLQPFAVSDKDITKEQAIEIAEQAFILNGRDLSHYPMRSAEYSEFCFREFDIVKSIKSKDPLFFPLERYLCEKWAVEFRGDQSNLVSYRVELSKKGRVLEIDPIAHFK